MANTGVFSRLQRLFSSDIIIRNVGGNQLSVIDSGKIQVGGELQTNALVDRFNRVYTTSTSLWGYQSSFTYQTLRPTLYSEYDAMDTDAIIASALDIIADESTLKNDMDEVLSIKSSDDNIQKILYNLFYDVLNIEFNLWMWIRNMCKYGDFFLKLEIAEKFGVYNVIPYTAYHIERIEGADKTNPSRVIFRFDPNGISASSYGYHSVPNVNEQRNTITFENYEVAHFRLLADMNFLPYGRCVKFDSKVCTENSTKEIQHIEKGDKVWTFNIEENKYELATVLATINSGIKKLYQINTIHSSISVTDNHPILVWDFETEKPIYKQTEKLKVGDYICLFKNNDIKIENTQFNEETSEINNNYNVKLSKIESIIEELPEETYDIQVDKNSNFVSNGIIVHNSYIEPARKLYKQYTLMEDAMLIHRIVRAPEKRIFYMNVGSIPPQEIDAFMEKTISKMKRTPYVDQQTGEYNLRYNLQNSLEDFYIPVRGNDTVTKIDTTKGLEYTAIDDVKYLRDKLFAALKIPRAFMGYEENLNGKSTLAAQDIRFARTIERIQRIITSELYKIALVHLYTQGYDNASLVNFELSLNTPSIIYEQEKVALLKDKVDLANQITEKYLIPSDWIYENVFDFSQNQYSEYRDLIVEDAKRTFRLKQISEEGNDPIMTGKSYGTPHDLASLYGKGRYESASVPESYDDDKKLGRPEEKVTDRNTQDDNFGKDRLGSKGLTDKADNGIKVNYKSKSPLALENSLVYLKDIPRSKKIIFEENSNDKGLLDESNIRE
jgi:hypothetical protein